MSIPPHPRSIPFIVYEPVGYADETAEWRLAFDTAIEQLDREFPAALANVKRDWLPPVLPASELTADSTR